MNIQGLVNSMNSLVSGIRTLAVPRIEDLPYESSKATQFVYQSSCEVGFTSSGAAGIAGNWIWDDRPSPMSPVRHLGENTLYFIRNITFLADISQNDFPDAIVIAPRFRLYKQSSLEAMILREPLIMPSFLENFDYRIAVFTSDSLDELLGSFRGQLVQTAALTGVTDITLTCVLSAQEVIDDGFLKNFKKGYPK